MSEELRRCPYCKEVPYRAGGDDPFAVHCCKAGDREEAVVERLSRWQSRPIEDELQAEIERLREAIQLAIDEFPRGSGLPLSLNVIRILSDALKAGRDE